MNVLIIGSGGRESAIAWAVSRSHRVRDLYIVPGNGGTLKYGENVHIELVYPYAELLEFINDASVDLVIVGPEQPLVDGIADVLKKVRVPVFGPTKKAAQLEGSKVFMKEFLARYNIPTARFRVFDNAPDALRFVRDQKRPFVVKTDGLAAGKGAIVNKTVEETLQAIERILVKQEFGRAGERIVVEDLLDGTEVSVFVATDGRDFRWIGSAQDHKRIFDNDEGPNTGGMGAYAPAPFLNERTREIIVENIIKPTIAGMAKEGAPYEGILYLGLMLTKSGPMVIEYNVRWGDPEAEAVIPLLKTDFVEIAECVAEGRLHSLEVELFSGFCCSVVLASKGYPGPYEKGHLVTGDFEDDRERFVFHAGTRQLSDGRVATTGGRVLCVSALGGSLQDAVDNAYDKVRGIRFEGMQYRKDIGAKGLKYFEK